MATEEIDPNEAVKEKGGAASRASLSGHRNVTATIGLDSMTSWIQRSLYNQTSNRGALFAEWESKRRTASVIFVALSIGGLLASMGYFFLSTDDMIKDEPWDFLGDVLKWGTVVMYLASIFVWHQLYTIKTRLHALTAYKDDDINAVGFARQLGSSGFTFGSWYRAGVLDEALLDLILLLPQPIPFMRVEVPIYEWSIHDTHIYELNWIMTMLMFCRLYFVPRTIADASHLSSFQARAIGNLNYINITPGFVLRTYLGQSVLAVCMFFMVLIVTFSFMMLIAEHPMVTSGLHHNFANCMWLIIITMTTVGYGDLYPVTILGRTVAVLAALSAVISTALFVSVVGQRLSLSRQEERVVSVIDRMERSKNLRITAAQCIGRMWRAYNKRCKEMKDVIFDENSPLNFLGKKRSSVTFEHGVAQAVTDFRDLRREYISDLLELGNDTALSKIQFQLTMHLAKINTNVEQQAVRLDELEMSVQQKLDAILASVSRGAGGGR